MRRDASTLSAVLQPAHRVAPARGWQMLTSSLMSDLDAIEAHFHRDGFVNAGPVLTADDARHLADELGALVARTFADGGRLVIREPILGYDSAAAPDEHQYQIARLWRASESFARVVFHPRINEIASRLMDSSRVQLWVDKAICKPATCGSHIAWHQDAAYHVSIEPPERLITAWVALDDVDVESGCMWMVPGSHLWGAQPAFMFQSKELSETEQFSALEPPDDAAIRARWRAPTPCIVRAGEVHFHHALTWHGSPVNRSPRPRRAFSMHLMPDGIRCSEEGDDRIPLSPGDLMVHAGEEFPILFEGSAPLRPPSA